MTSTFFFRQRGCTRTETRPVFNKTSFLLAAGFFLNTFLASSGSCEDTCNPHKPPCSEYVAVDLNVCNVLHSKKLEDATKRCKIIVVEGSIAAGSTASIISASLSQIPRCTSRYSGRSGASFHVTASRLGDLHFPEQSNSHAEGLDFYNTYHTLERLQEKWSSLENSSNLIQVEKIGTSIQTRDIQLIRICQTEDASPVRIFINGLQHAREWAGTMIVTYIAEQLASSLSGEDLSSAKIQEDSRDMADALAILQKVEVLVAPMANPDGYVYTQKSRFHRKNMRENSAVGCVGVDLNRNWNTDYGGSGSSSSDPCEDTYRGTAAFSEPETRALRSIVQREGVVAHIDYHAYGGMVLGPWSYTFTAPRNASAWRGFGAALADGIARRGNTYRVGTGDARILPYLASGVMSDWVFAQNVTSATIEVAPIVRQGDASLGLSGFVLEGSALRQACSENFAGFVNVLRWINATVPAARASPPLEVSAAPSVAGTAEHTAAVPSRAPSATGAGDSEAKQTGDAQVASQQANGSEKKLLSGAARVVVSITAGVAVLALCAAGVWVWSVKQNASEPQLGADV